MALEHTAYCTELRALQPLLGGRGEAISRGTYFGRVVWRHNIGWRVEDCRRGIERGAHTRSSPPFLSQQWRLSAHNQIMGTWYVLLWAEETLVIIASSQSADCCNRQYRRSADCCNLEREGVQIAATVSTEGVQIAATLSEKECRLLQPWARRSADWLQPSISTDQIQNPTRACIQFSIYF